MTTEATTTAQIREALRDAGFSTPIQYTDSVADAPNAYLATTAEDLFAALEAQNYSEGW